jgi:hypothetical protein
MRILLWPFKLVLRLLCWVILLGLVAWVFGALFYDMPFLNQAAAWFWLGSAATMLLFIRQAWRKSLFIGLAFVGVLSWWLKLQPQANREWQPDVAQLPWAEVVGDEVTIHNVRNFDYRTTTDYTANWETRKVRLSQLTGIDLFINYWGSPWMAHPIASFQFKDAPPICFSIETRKEVGEKYSAIGGFYRQYELICIAADERDIVRVRTNYRTGEDSYLYRIPVSPERARERFMEYVATMNGLRNKPRWYNAATTNCTTAIRTQRPASERAPWDWRILLNGKADEMLYERKAFVTDGLSFPELREKAHINTAAQAADKSPDFWKLIREGRPGFGPIPGGKAAAP